MFIVAKRGLKLDGANPTLLYGYGGFDISLTPSFSVTDLVWMEMGGVFAMANLRGGGEYGQEWHRAGMKAKKQNVFDDFISAAEWLIANHYTSTPKLAWRKSGRAITAETVSPRVRGAVGPVAAALASTPLPLNAAKSASTLTRTMNPPIRFS